MPGLLFHNKDWMGGYSSWRRRLTRLGHISFFGIAALNLGFFLTMQVIKTEVSTTLPSILFVVGAISMPSICYLSAWKKPIRNLFFIPVASLIVATLFTLYLILSR
ncbi:MAG: hypothetical protein AB3N63_09130 [Puniceicoccaceae bacterium]